MADLLAHDKYQDETTSISDNSTSTSDDDTDLKTQLPDKNAKNSDSDSDGESTQIDKGNKSLRDANLSHESNGAPISKSKSDQRREVESVKDCSHKPFLTNGRETEEHPMECSGDNSNREISNENSIPNDEMLNEQTEKSYSEDDQNLHNYDNTRHRANESASKSGGERHILDVKHLNDSGIDITDMETERIIENSLQSSNVDETRHDTNAVIYDETAPRRINRPSRLKLQTPEDDSKLFMDGIDKLISPDATKSPTRTRRSGSVEIPHYKAASKARPIIVYNEPEEYEDSKEIVNHLEQNQKRQHRTVSMPQRNYDPNRLIVDDIQQHHHYKKSPDMQRKSLSTVLEQTKRSESPVLRAKSRSESSPSTYRKYGRKISSEARLAGGAPDYKRQPIRKISSNARLEHVMESLDNVPEEGPKSRRVSFGTATYIKHNQENTTEADLANIRHNKPERAEIHKNEYNERKVDNDDVRNGDIRTQARLDNRQIKETQENHITKATTGFDNKAYIEDEINDHPIHTMKIIDSQTGTSMKVKENINSIIKESPSTESLILFEATRSLEQNHMGKKNKKISTHSLPDVSRNAHEQTVFRHSVGVTDSPRSILKVKADDSVSNASAESFSKGKRYKVKRNSVSLYHEQHGDVQKGPWVGISRKDFKRVIEPLHENTNNLAN